MVRAEPGLRVAEVDGEVGDPVVFAEGSGDGFFAMVEELSEDVIFL